MMNAAAGKTEPSADACTLAKEQGEGLRVTPIGWEKTREILKPLFDDRKHWIIVAHVTASPLIETIEQKYYLNEKNSAFTLITAFWRGQGYAIVAARKRWMRDFQLSSLLRQMIKFDIGEMVGRDLFVPAPPWLLNDAVALTSYLFDNQELAIEA